MPLVGFGKVSFSKLLAEYMTKLNNSFNIIKCKTNKEATLVICSIVKALTPQSTKEADRTPLWCSIHFLRALHQNRSGVRLLYLLIIIFMAFFRQL